MTDLHDDDLFDDDETSTPAQAPAPAAAAAPAAVRTPVGGAAKPPVGDKPASGRKPSMAAAVRLAIRKLGQVNEADADLVDLACSYAGVRGSKPLADRVIALLEANPAGLLELADIEAGPHLSLHLFSSGRDRMRPMWAALRGLGIVTGELNPSDAKAAVMLADTIALLDVPDRHRLKAAAGLCGRPK